jgi:hypothetical protein
MGNFHDSLLLASNIPFLVVINYKRKIEKVSIKCQRRWASWMSILRNAFRKFPGKSSRGKLFYRLVQQTIALDPVPGKLIVGGRPRI